MLNMSFRVGYDKKAGIITSDRPAIIKSGEFSCEEYTKRLDLFLMADDREVLQDAGKITAEIAKAKAETEFEKYRVIQDRLFMSDFDKYMLELEENAKKE